MVLRRLHLAAAVLFVVTIVAQVFLAGAALANLGGSGNFSTHVEVGYTWIGLAALILLVTAFVARRPRADIGTTALIIILYIVQTILPTFRSSAPALAALHPVNALFLFGLAAVYARRLWRAEMA
jgi:uncharacterized membrane protein YhaH (DUF805 family)